MKQLITLFAAAALLFSCSAPCERVIFQDEKTGHEVWRLSQKDSSIVTYFEAQAFTHDDAYCVFKSNRDGAWKLYASDMKTGAVSKISDRVVKGTYSIYATGDEVVFVDSNVVYAINVRTHAERVLLDVSYIPGKVFTNGLFTNDGEYTALTVKDSDSTYIYRARVSDGSVQKVYARKTGFTHPMINPVNPDLITFVPKPDLRMEWELSMEERARGMLLNVADGSVKPFVMSEKYWKATHESWSKDGERLYYFDKKREDGHWVICVTSMAKDGSDKKVHYTNTRYKLAHGIANWDGSYFVCDVEEASENPLYYIDLETGEAEVLCWPNAQYVHPGNCQTDHVHPLISKSGKYIAFTTDGWTPGVANAYVVPVEIQD